MDDNKKEQKNQKKQGRLSKVLSPVLSARRRVGAGIANTRRRIFVKRLPDYIVFEITGSIETRPAHQPKWYSYLPGRKSALSMAFLNDALHKIAGDPDIKGILFLLKETNFSLAQAQNLSMLFDRFRTWDKEYQEKRGWKRGGADSDEASKEIVVYLEQTSIPGYVMSCGADRVVMAPLVDWGVTGLRVEPTYLKDTLARFGIEFDVVKIAPWKTAADSTSRSTMSDEERIQYNWLLDSIYHNIVQAVTTGRDVVEEKVKSLIDNAPLTAEQAKEADLIDHIAYEDELAILLGSSDEEVADLESAETRSETLDEDTKKENTELEHEGLENRALESVAVENIEPERNEPDDQESDDQTKNQKTSENHASIKPYSKIQSLLFRHPQKGRLCTVGVISLSGAIISGSSRSFPFPLPMLGSNTIGSSSAQQLIRAAREDMRLDAVVLHINSPGGSALASDLIWRELKLLDEEKPLVVYMGDVAASGGYYLSIPGRKIVAQATTLTGSIGVVTSKPVDQGTYDKLDANREVVQRGAMAGLYTSASAWSDEERQKVTEGVDYVYHAFKERVAESRGLDYDSLDEICHGRVWTGEQALAHNLIDAIGDIHTAIEMACELAEMPAERTVRTVDISPPKVTKFAMPAHAQEAMEVVETFQEVGKLASSMLQGEWEQLWGTERHWLIADGLPKFKWQK